MATERVLNLDEMLKRFEFLGAKLPEAVFVAMMLSAKAMLASVTRKLAGEYLNVQTGHGRQSMEDFARRSGGKMAAGIDTDVGYMKAHEQGFHGTVNVPAHLAQHRHGRTLAVDARTRAISKRARITKRQAARGVWTVRAHSRLMNLRARHFMRDTINQQFDPTASRIERAVVITALKGKVPTFAELNRAV